MKMENLIKVLENYTEEKDTVNTTLLLKNKKRPNEPNTLGQNAKMPHEKIMHI